MAINAKIDLKKPVLEEISAQVEGAQCVLLVNYSGLTVAQDTQLRKELRETCIRWYCFRVSYQRPGWHKRYRNQQGRCNSSGKNHR